MFPTRTVGSLALTLLLPLLSACDGDGSGVLITDRLLLRSMLAAVNSGISSPAATAEIQITGDVVNIRITATGLGSIPHLQFIGLGPGCPTAASDLNSDGVIDIVEGLDQFGPFLLSLDDDLADNAIDDDVFSASTTINYSFTGSLSAIRASVTGTGANQIPPGQPLDFAGMTVTLHGATAVLPPTAGTLDPYTANQTVPVACGVLEPLNF